MRFGRQRPPGRLLFARSLVYLQAGMLLIIDGIAVLFALTGGITLSLQGYLARPSGTGLLIAGVLQLGFAAALVLLDKEAATNPVSYRGGMTALQVVFGIYMVGFVGTGAGTWLFGPIFCAIVIGLHWWPELERLVLGSYQTEPPARAEAADGGRPNPMPTTAPIQAMAPPDTPEPARAAEAAPPAESLRQ